MGHASQKGMTLVEVLVALSLFGVVAIASMSLLSMGLDADAKLRVVSAQMEEFQPARTLIKRDLGQIAARTPRNELGQASIGPVLGGSFNNGFVDINEAGEELLLSFVSNGGSNLQDQYPVSTLRYIEYRTTNAAVIRREWAYVDRAQGSRVNERVLFTDVQDVEVMFFDGAVWQNQWRSRAEQIAPSAVRLSFIHGALGQVEQAFVIQEIAR